MAVACIKCAKVNRFHAIAVGEQIRHIFRLDDSVRAKNYASYHLAIIKRSVHIGYLCEVDATQINLIFEMTAATGEHIPNGFDIL